MGLHAVRNADVVVLALALPLFLLTGITIVGWLIAAGAWTAQRIVRHLVTRRAHATEEMRNKVGLVVGGMIARGWLAAGIIFGVGVATSDEAGLSGALLFIATFTAWFTGGLLARGFEGPDAEAGR